MLTNSTYFPSEGRTEQFILCIFCNVTPVFEKKPHPENHKSKALWIKDSIPAQQ
jgi:hypothetical protein